MTQELQTASSLLQHPKSPLPAGINLGYGHIKLSTPAGDFITASAFAPTNRLYDGIGRKRNTHLVDLDGKTYEVGSDAITLARAKETVRIPEPKWLHTQRYRVFSRLVMDRLALESDHWNVVIGMPISDFEDVDYRQELESYWEDTHDTASGPIHIHHARLVPEPIGALFAESAHLTDEQKQAASLQNDLIIDPGYFTSDWLALYHLSPDFQQSGGIDIGMHHLLKELSKLIASRYSQTDSDLVTLESLLLSQIHHPESMTKASIPLFDLAKEAAREVFAPMVDNLRSAVWSWSSSSEEKSILITGGAASFVHPLVEEAWPKTPVRLASNSQMANALGYREMAAMIFAENMDNPDPSL